MSQRRKQTKWNKKRKLVFGSLSVICLAVIAGIVFLKKQPKEEAVEYKEKTVAKGVLQSGVTERGSIDIGTIEQSFELDMSALQRVNTSGSGSSSGAGSQSGNGAGGFGGMGGQIAGGGMAMFGQMTNMAGNNTFTQSGDKSSLTVKEVCVSVGQEIKAGDVLYVLEEDSVQKLKATLESDVEKARADLDRITADQKVSGQSAKTTYDESIAYGSYMQAEYDNTVAELSSSVAEAEDTLKQAENSLAEYQALYAETRTAYEEALQVLEGCEWSRDHVDKEEHVGNYVYAFQMAQQAQSIVDQLEQKRSQLETRIENAEKTVQRARKAFNQAKRKAEQGKLEADETLSLRQLAYDTAQETYDITMAYLEVNEKEQEETYNDAKEKWDSFAAYIDGCNLCSRYDGTVTSVELSVGDSVDTDTLLITLNSRTDMTMTVSIDEDDMEGIAVGVMAKVVLTAFPDDVFEAAVTEISEAQSDRAGNVTYDVTATLTGELAQLYQSMTGEITFITGQTQEEVIYVAKRAVTVDGEKSTVKVRKSDKTVEVREVVTGFTDGVNIEIKEGLSEGEIVLVESRVNGK